MMKKIAILLLVVAIPLLIFGYLGSFTPWGHTRYDEMDGMYPFFAWIISGFLVFISAILFIIHYTKK